MKRILALFAALLLVIPLAGCKAAETSHSFFAMDTVMTAHVWSRHAGSDAAAVQKLVGELEHRLSVTDADSELARLNEAGAGTVSDDTMDLLQQALLLSERTGGALDPTLYPIVRLWGFTTKDYRVPSDEEIAQTLTTVGTEHIGIEGSTVTLTGGARLDFGALGKGYASQQAAEKLEDAGVEAAMLSFGGNVQTVGTKPDGKPWQIGIRSPENADTAVAVLRLEGSHAVVTSGAYQRYFEEDGVIYSHIMDPETGAPVQGDLASVTIVANDGLLADALSTALFVMGLDAACEFWRTSDDFEAVLIDQNGSIHVTEGLSGSIDCTDFEVIAR